MGDSQQWKPTAWEAGSLKSMCQGGLSLESFREGLSWPLPASDAPPHVPWLLASRLREFHLPFLVSPYMAFPLCMSVSVSKGY